MCLDFKIFPLGDSGILIQFENAISEETNRKVHYFSNNILNQNINGIAEVIPSYNSLQVIYNPIIITYNELSSILKSMEFQMDNSSYNTYEVINIPVLYDIDFEYDLKFVSSHNKISPEEVINIHSAKEYLIYMIGFTPGFPYLGGMDERISAPRLESPRSLIPAGSVGIAGLQTGIYPIDSPGGWRIIGKTPLRLFNPTLEPPVLLKAGQYIKFQPISKEEFCMIQANVNKNNYHPVISYIKKGVS